MYTFGIMHERLKPSLRDVVRLQKEVKTPRRDEVAFG